MRAVEALTPELRSEEWIALGVLATERRLPLSVLAKITGTGAETRARLEAWVSLGLVREAGTMQSLSARSAIGERAFSAGPGCRVRILRKLAREGGLAEVREAAKRAVGDKALAGFVTALYGGSLARLERALPELRWSFAAPEAGAFARAMLLESVCSPFEPDCFGETWAEEAPAVAEQVLTDALFTLEPVDGLYQWLAERRDGTRPSALRVLAEHAFLRADRGVLHGIGAELAAAEQLAIEAAVSYLDGDSVRAQRCAHEFIAWEGGGRVSISGMPSMAALLSLLSAARALADGAAFAKRLVRAPRDSESLIRGWTAAPTLTAVGRAARLLLRHLSLGRNERPRLDVHQVPSDAAAWETLLQALTVHLQRDPPLARAAWARRLARDAARYEANRYAWFSAQAAHLAALLDPEAAPASHTNGRTSAWLAECLQPEPEWKRSLDALAAFATDPGGASQLLPMRVAWFVDMAAGTLSKPAIEEFRSGAGWTRTRRLGMAELRELERDLPPEDAAVLRAFDGASGVEPGLAALEALTSHPRVFNGARGSVTVEVLRGIPRVETRREGGHLLVRVEPSGATAPVHAVVESEQRIVVYRLSDAMTKLSRTLQGELRVPEGHAKDVLPVLAKLAEHVEVRSLDLAAERAVEADSTPCLRVSPEAGAFWVELGVRPFGSSGRFFPPGAGSADLSVHAEGALLRTVRDLNEERDRAADLIARAPTLAAARAEDAEGSPNDAYSFALGEESLYALLLELERSGVRVELEWQNCRPIRGRGTLTGRSLYGRLRRTKGWYLVSGSVRIDEVTQARLSEVVGMPFTKTGRFLRLPSGDFVEVERRARQVLQALRTTPALRTSSRSSGELRIPEAAFGALRALREADTGLELDEAGKTWLSQVDEALSADYELPAGLVATLRPYQLEGYRWLRRLCALGFGVCLADDMGLGKTVQVIALLLARAGGGPAIVVAPTSVCTNWIEELAKFAPGLKAVEYAGKNRRRVLDALASSPDPKIVRPDVVIVSYALLQQDAEALTDLSFHTAVLDEAQFIKNAESLRARAAFRLQADYRVALTGTPVENHLGDLWSLFHFLNPALLGTWKEFQLRFQNPIERDGDGELRAVLRSVIQPFLLRRTKDEVLKELPPLTVVRHEVRLSREEALLYGVLRRQIHEKLRTPHGKRQHKLQVFAELVRLRRFCCHPRLVFPDASAECSKMEVFLALVEELRQNGHRALVFSQFVDFLEIVRERLDERRIRYLYLDGATPKEARHARVAAFQDGEADLFLISLKAGGFGVNLTAADYVIHLDPWWNPAVEAQATDRAHRIGQGRPVTVYRLITKETIEESILELHGHKKAIADAVLEGSGAAAHLSAEDLRALIGAPE